MRTLGGVVALAVWAPATAFFMTIALIVGREMFAGHGSLHAPIADVKGMLVTGAYSLGGGAIGLGLAWLVLPPRLARGLWPSAALWLGTTALLLGTRRVDGGPLLFSALMASGIGIDVDRRLILGLAAAWHPDTAKL